MRVKIDMRCFGAWELFFYLFLFLKVFCPTSKTVRFSIFNQSLSIFSSEFHPFKPPSIPPWGETFILQKNLLAKSKTVRFSIFSRSWVVNESVVNNAKVHY